ncbi:MAG: sugar nucleotide-binding protein [Patescibacteria group bacterium]
MTTLPYPKTLVLGGSGFIGSRLKELYVDLAQNLLFVSSNDVDILDFESLQNFIRQSGIDVVLNLAAYTDVKGSLAEIGNKDGLAWKLNVEGTSNVAKVCRQGGLYLSYISTDNVFYGGNGPFDEYDKLVNDGTVDWYGFTKRKAEEVVEKYCDKFSIVRIAYPFGSRDMNKDYVLKLIEGIKKDRPLFNDQKFSPTYISVLGDALKNIISNKLVGKFHVACREITTPFEIGTFLAKQIKIDNEVKPGSILDYEKLIGKKSPYNPNGGLKVKKTEELLDMEFPTWKEAVTDYISNNFKDSKPLESA